MSEIGSTWPDRTWFDHVIGDRACRFTRESDIQRLHRVLVKITEAAIRNAAGAPPSSKQRDILRNTVKRLRNDFDNLAEALEGIDFEYRPHSIKERLLKPSFVATLNELDDWLMLDDASAPGRGNSRDPWEHSLLCQIIGYYDLAFGVEWKLTPRAIRTRGPGEKITQKLEREVIANTGAVAQFIFAYVESVRRSLQNEDSPVARRWTFQSTKAVQDRIARINANEVNIVAEPRWAVEGPDAREPRTTSLAKLYWLELGGTAVR